MGYSKAKSRFISDAGPHAGVATQPTREGR